MSRFAMSKLKCTSYAQLFLPRRIQFCCCFWIFEWMLLYFMNLHRFSSDSKTLLISRNGAGTITDHLFRMCSGFGHFGAHQFLWNHAETGKWTFYGKNSVILPTKYCRELIAVIVLIGNETVLKGKL